MPETRGQEPLHAPLTRPIDLQAAIECAGSGIAISDEQGRFVYANPVFCQMSGYSLEELRGRDSLSIVHPDDREKDMRVLRKLQDGGGPNYLIEKRIIRKTGEAIWVEHAVSAILDAEGRVVHIVSVSQDATERQNYKQALEESERGYRALFDDSPFPIYVFDVETLDFLAINRPALDQYGYALEEILRMKVTAILRQVEVAKLTAVLGQSSGGQILRQCRKDGSCFDAEITSHRIRFDGREARVDIVKDVTQALQAELRLRESEERFRSTFDQSALGMAHVSPNGRWLRVNQKLCDILGYTPGQLIKLSFQDITADEDLAASLEMRRKMISGQVGTYTAEKRYIRADGSLLWVKITTSLVRSPEGEPSYFITAVQDIAQAKKIEMDLQLSEARFRALTENSADRTAVLDGMGRITYATASSTRIFGYSPEEVVGFRFFDFIHNDDLKSCEEDFEKLAGKPGSSAHLRYRSLHKDGRILWVDCRGFNALDNPAVAGIVINERDITEERELEAQFLRAQRLESVGTLASGIAHDLNNILAPILMSAPMLRTGELDEEMRDNLVTTIEASAQRGADIVRQILTFTRGIQGERLLLQPIHILKEVSNIARETFPKNIVVNTLYSNDIWPVYGDPTQLHQVFMNLAVNARDAMPSGGTITLAAENVTIDEHYAATLGNGMVAGDYLSFSVADTGSGIPAEIRDRIFDPFFTTKELGKGTGLGLSTVIGIIRSHKGSITLASEVGKGTKFTIFLPATPGQTAGGKEDDTGPEMLQGHGELVLVVDDERGVLEMSRLVLERAGYRIAIARDGIEGLAFYARHVDEVTIVLTDIHMPKSDGMALIPAMRKLNPAVPIIGSSGETGENEEEKLRGLGVDHYLKKPYTKKQLLRTIEKALQVEQHFHI